MPGCLGPADRTPQTHCGNNALKKRAGVPEVSSIVSWKIFRGSRSCLLLVKNVALQSSVRTCGDCKKPALVPEHASTAPDQTDGAQADTEHRPGRWLWR